MDENEKKTAEAPQEQPKPEDYSRYMEIGRAHV